MDVGKQLTALGDPTRRTIYELVRANHGSVRELTELVSVSQPAVSQHLKVLREADLVSVTRTGTRSCYSPKRDGMERLRLWIDQMWDDALDAFADAAQHQVSTAETREEAPT
jgi:DNA-binding transcriptional ArsR family regulator